MKLTVYPRLAWGKKLFAFADKKQAAIIHALTGTTYLTKAKIDALEALGHTVQIIGTDSPISSSN